jgi:hypothetical protein
MVEADLGFGGRCKTRYRGLAGGGVPEITAQEICKEMVDHDLAQTKQHTLLKYHGYTVNASVK